eukprot:gene2599-11738_t
MDEHTHATGSTGRPKAAATDEHLDETDNSEEQHASTSTRAQRHDHKRNQHEKESVRARQLRGTSTRTTSDEHNTTNSVYCLEPDLPTAT